jgi:SEC-C motif domain protein
MPDSGARRPVSALPTASPTDPCPCGSGQALGHCCGRFLDGPERGLAPDAPTLMRSRYTAFVLGRVDYLRDTWHPRTRPATLEPLPEGLRWLGLEVRRHASHDANHAVVEFVARSKLVDGRWLYVDGNLR